MYTIPLPKETAQRETVATTLLNRGEQLRNPQAVRWWIAHWYMRGARNFSNINYKDGTINISYLSDSGKLEFVFEYILSKYQAQLGQLINMDLRPAIKRKGISLDGMRKAGIAQMALDAAFPDTKAEKLKMALLPPLLMYGTVGLGLWVLDEDSMGIDTIMPWEIVPIPPTVTDPTKTRGIMRSRWVPAAWIKQLDITPGAKSKAYGDLEVVRAATGQIPDAVDEKFQGTISTSISGEAMYINSPSWKNNNLGTKKDKTQMDLTKLVETWTWTPDGYLATYDVFSGIKKLKLMYTSDHSEHKVHRPIEIVGDTPVGGLWGRSFVDRLISINTELEYAIARQYQNLQEFDLYGILMEPTTNGLPAEIIRGADGLKRARFEPDWTVPEVKPYNISPVNSNLLPYRLIDMGIGLIDKMAQQSKMLEGDAPGRIDSSTGLGTLFEIGNIPLGPTAKAIALGVSGIYRAMLGQVRDRWTGSKIVDVTRLDDAIAGIHFDASTGQMRLAENAIPHPDEITVSIASDIPISETQQKAELREELEMGNLEPWEYRIEVRKRGLSRPVGHEVEWQNYRRAMLENLLLFGDGETPDTKKVIITDRDMHKIHMAVLEAFMARPEFFAASTAVRNAFVKHYEEHFAGMGAYPSQLEYPEEAAEQEMAQLQQMLGASAEQPTVP